MTKGQAIARVAEALIGHINGSTLEELLGVRYGDLSEKDGDRMEAAQDYVISKLIPLTRRK